MTKLKELKSKIEQLPPKAINDLGAYVDFLMQGNNRKVTGKLSQKWAGGLKNLKANFTSLELQKKALEWRKD